MNKEQTTALKIAYQSYFQGKRAEIQYQKISNDLSTAKTAIRALEDNGYIEKVNSAIGYVSFVLTDFAITYCEEIFS